MRKILGAAACTILLVVYLAPLAQSEPVDSSLAHGTGWSVTAPGGISSIGPESEACWPTRPPSDPDPCDQTDVNELVGDPNIEVGGTVATASVLRSEAETHEDADAATSVGAVATLQSQMQTASGVALPTRWNARGYARVEGFSALNGQILADSIEAEAVAGTRDNGTKIDEAKATGVRVVNLRVAGVLVGSTDPYVNLVFDPTIPNQVLLNTAGIRIAYWDTNWDTADASANPDEASVFVYALRITDANTGTEIYVSRADAIAEYTAPAAPVNQPPVANDDSATTQQGDSVNINVTANDTDPDGAGDIDQTSVSVTKDPGNGTVTCVDNICTYTPNAGFSGNDSFEYTVCDASGACDTAVVSITVTAPAADPVAPVADDDTASTNEDTSVAIDVVANDRDADGDLDPSTVSIVQNPSSGAVVCNNTGTCTYTPSTGFSGTDTFTYQVCDSTELCDSATVTITVSGAATGGGNTPPDAEDDSATTTEGSSVQIDVDANDTDVDGNLDPSSAAITIHPTNGAVICVNATCTYTPSAGFTGTDTFTYRICDTDGACATAVVTIDVTAAPPGGEPPTNNPPQPQDDTASTPRNTAVAINVIGNDSDPDGDELVPGSVTVTVQPEHGSVSCSQGVCTYTPETGYTGTDTFQYRVCDTSNACATALVTISVIAPAVENNAPLAGDDSASTQVGTPVVIPITSNDSDPDGNLVPSSAAITIAPTNGAVICNNGSCTYTPKPGFTGTDTFTYRVCDSDGLCDSAVVTITVTEASTAPPAYNPPVARDDSITSDGGSVTIPVIGNDSGGDGTLDPSTVAVTRPPAHGAVICAAGSCTYTPEPGFTGTDDFEYRVCNDDGVCDTATVVIDVTGAAPGDDQNQPPVARDDSVTAEPGQPIQIIVVDNDTDPDGNLDPGTVTVVRPPQHGSVVCSEGTCTYTPEPGFTGDDDFDYRVCDEDGSCSTGTVTITVPPADNDGTGEPGGSIGEGGSSGGGNNGGGSNGGPGGSDRPNRDGQPSGPNKAPAAPEAPAPPVTSLNPILGAPNNPALPMTGGEPGFYLALAFNLVLAGGLLLFLDARSRREAIWNVPALLSGGTDVLDRTETPVEIVLSGTEPEAEVALEPEPVVAPPVAEEPKPEPQKQPAPKPAATKKKAVAKKAAPKKPAATKTATAKKPAAKKAASTKASTAKKSTVAKKASSTKKSTVAKKSTAAKKSTVTKKPSSTKKSTVAKKKS